MALRTTDRRMLARLLLWAVSMQAALTATDTRSIRSIGAEAEEVAARRLAAIRIEAALRHSYISSRDETRPYMSVRLGIPLLEYYILPK